MTRSVEKRSAEWYRNKCAKQRISSFFGQALAIRDECREICERQGQDAERSKKFFPGERKIIPDDSEKSVNPGYYHGLIATK